MPLILNERVQADLALMAKMPAEGECARFLLSACLLSISAHRVRSSLFLAVVKDFCGVCLDFVEAGPKKGVFNRAAAALGVEPDAVAGAVMALTELLLTASKSRASESELLSVLIDTGLPEDSRKVIAEFYQSSSRRLRAHLGGVEADSTPQFKSFDWRLHVTVASRFAHDSMEPGYMVRFDTVAPVSSSASSVAAGEAPPVSSLHATADYAALRRISESLDAAAAELNTATSKRIQRYIR
jgi:hypothetical protein